MQSLSDEQLMHVYMNNKDSRGKQALDCLYLRYSGSMYRFFFFNLKNNPELARDFVHDLFLRIIEKANQYNHSKPFKPWLYRIASNMCKNEYRTAQVVQKFVNEKVKVDPEHSNISFENNLRTCINQLEQDHKALIIMRFSIKLSIKEMAEIFECPEGTIKSRLYYATKELSKLYNE